MNYLRSIGNGIYSAFNARVNIYEDKDEEETVASSPAVKKSPQRIEDPHTAMYINRYKDRKDKAIITHFNGTPLKDVPEKIIEEARQNLLAKLKIQHPGRDIQLDDIRLVAAKAVFFSNGNLNCVPPPGFISSSACIYGTSFRFFYGPEVYHIHAAEDELRSPEADVVACPEAVIESALRGLSEKNRAPVFKTDITILEAIMMPTRLIPLNAYGKDFESYLKQPEENVYRLIIEYGLNSYVHYCNEQGVVRNRIGE